MHPMKRGITQKNLVESTQHHCVAVIEDSDKHDRTRRLYNKMATGITDERNTRLEIQNGNHRDITIERMSSISSLTGGTGSTGSRSRNLINRVKQRRENAARIKSTRSLVKGRSAKCVQAKEVLDEEVEEEKEEQQPPPQAPEVSPVAQMYPYAFPPHMLHPGMQGMPYPPGMPGYYMPPTPPHVMIAPGSWGYPGTQPPQQGVAMGPELTQQQLLEQQRINQQQQDLIRQHQQLYEQQQEQLIEQQEQLLRHRRLSQRQALSSPMSRAPPPPQHQPGVQPPAAQQQHDHQGAPLKSFGVLDQIRSKADTAGGEAPKPHPPGARRDWRGSQSSSSERETKSSATGNATLNCKRTDEFSVGILGIGDISILEQTIGHLKRNSFSDKFNPEKSQGEGERTAKMRGGMHGSFVEKTRDGLGKRTSGRTSQVLSKAVQRLQSQESLELDFDDVYSGHRRESFTPKSGMLDTSRRKSFKRQDSCGSRNNFAFENPNFSH